MPQTKEFKISIHSSKMYLQEGHNLQLVVEQIIKCAVVKAAGIRELTMDITRLNIVQKVAKLRI